MSYACVGGTFYEYPLDTRMDEREQTNSIKAHELGYWGRLKSAF